MSPDVMTAVGVGAIVVLLIAVKVLTRGGTASLYPTGDPAKDSASLATWWAREAAKAELPGAIETSHAPYAEAAREPSPFWKSFAPGGIFFAESALPAVHVHTARLPWSRPLVARVFTAANGTIARVVFEASLGRSIAGDAVYRKKFVELSQLFSGAAKFEGPGAEALNSDKAILAAADRALTLSYVPPRGLQGQLVSKNGTVTLTPAPDGATLLVDTLPRPGSFGNPQLGLAQVLELCRKLS